MRIDFSFHGTNERCGSRLVAVRESRVAVLSTNDEELAADCFLTGELADRVYELAGDAVVPAGLFEGTPVFAADCRAIGEDEFTGISASAEFRSLYARLSDEVFWFVGRAIHLLHWHRNTRFCGRCGAKLDWAERETAKICAECGFLQYPRISPAVIVAITRQGKQGREILLARQRGRGTGKFGLIAGFIEPGESAEEAVVRETREETGIEIRDVRYVCSQPWPFPENLMLGYTAEYAGGELRMQESELEELGWYSGNNLPVLSSQMSLSWKLTRYVFDSAATGFRQHSGDRHIES